MSLTRLFKTNFFYVLLDHLKFLLGPSKFNRAVES